MEKKTVLITGASEGIGFEIAKQFANKKYPLILVARNEEKLAYASAQLSPYTEILTISTDLTKHNAAKHLYDLLYSQNIKVDILVNNAGIGLEGAFQTLSLEKQIQMIQLNINALTELTHYFVQGMVERQYGRIINLSSISGPIPTAQMAVYSGTKAFVLNFSQALHTELKKHGNIVVTAVCPGPTKTDFTITGSMNSLGKMTNIIGVSAKSVAIATVKCIKQKKRVIIPNTRYKALLSLAKLTPTNYIQIIMHKLMKG
ncbi:SDR family oxidoreductase [Lysinibacillus sp. KU-BSD001]|uniref:SDR family NAD(P)-dependent oxidoreductase n=1 Tax=Lysinibacillus sp. KU-BSD001 TaxID=3141328 RepID=UPI0036EFC76B